MSRFPAVTSGVMETAPPRVIQIDRRMTVEKKLETIHEETEELKSIRGKPVSGVGSRKTATYGLARRPSAVNC
ncbi:hypothetical protein Cni_G16204 [Canna indica]|uniref:Uncharacterized protein n=1 Tax=Canna indica TaxID=4628 RepID=A0AAQ3KI99_9LILI|nr:hypothetical protein Cni_G16204 [Canna indica]